MSKKDRLKAQSEKQLILKKELEQQELAEKAEASGRSSKAGEKLRKKARKANNILTLILKLLMILPFGYSAFYYGGIFIVGIATGEMVGMPKRIAVFLAIGAVLCLAGLFLAFFSRYILQFAFIAVGTASFMYSAGYIISETQKKLEINYVSDAELQKLDKTYMTYFYPLLIMTLISAVLLAIYIVKRIKKKRAEKRERDNAPVKSIID